MKMVSIKISDQSAPCLATISTLFQSTAIDLVRFQYDTQVHIGYVDPFLVGRVYTT